MSLDYPQKSKTKNPQNQPEWYQPLIPGMEEFLAQLKHNSKTSSKSKSK